MISKARPTSARKCLAGIVLLAFWSAVPSARCEMELLFREMFATSGQINEVNPGNQFTRVQGIFHHRPGGPRLEGFPAASADLRNVDPAPFAIVDLPTDNEPRLFIGAWFLFKSLQEHGGRLLTVTDPFENPGPAIFVEGNTLKTGSEHSSLTKVPFPGSPLNRWVFLGLAVVKHANRQATMRFYYKFPGEPMQAWAAYDDVGIGLPQLGGFELGVRTSSSGVRCRFGAPSAYRFENNDFSDIVYPADLIEPVSGLTWYCNPATGNDANDGTAPDRAWKSVSKINEESTYTGLLSSEGPETGDTLIIDTSSAPLETDGEVLGISTPGLNVRAAPGNEWIRIKSYRSLAANGWVPSSIPNVYQTTDTEPHIVVWEEDKFLHHPRGADISAVSAFLAKTPGAFWTDGTNLYLHPFGSSDPRSDGKRYERSYSYGNESAVMLTAPNLHVRDLHVGKTCLDHAINDDSIGSYCLGTDGPLGNSRIAHGFFYYGSKHNFGLTTGGPGDDVLVEDVQCEQGSPYVGPGGQTVFVSFNQQPLDLNITHRFHRCRTVMNAGLIGSSAGTATALYPVYFSHNIGNPGEPEQFALIEFVDCDFGLGSVFGAAAKQVRFESSVAGSLGFNGNLAIERGHLRGPLWSLEGRSVVARNSVFERSGSLPASPVAGHLDIQGCTFDGTGVTGISAQDAAFFTRSGPLEFIFRNNAVILPEAARNFGFFSRFRDTDALSMSHNAYRLGGNRIATFFVEGSQTYDPSFPQWQAAVQDDMSFESGDLKVLVLAPLADSPLLDAGAELTPADDFTGKPLFRRNDIGAFEGPPTRFDEWQFANFDDEELLQEGISGSGGSLFGDGVPNLMKYGLGLSARTPARPNHIEFKSPPGSPAAFEFTRSLVPIDLEWVLERSTDLRAWEEVTNPSIQILSTGDSTESVRLNLPAETGTRFYRIKLREKVP